MKRFYVFGFVLLAMLVFVGCSEDTVTPNDDIVITDEDVAYQSGFVARAIVEVLPEMADRTVLETVYLDPPFSGGFYHETDPDERVYTDDILKLSLEIEDFGTTVIFEFDISATGDPLVANGSGSITAAALYLTFEVINVVVVDGYPVSGSVEVTESSSRVATITFDGDHTATITINDLVFVVDLDTGLIIE
jgi:hypothetical protein